MERSGGGMAGAKRKWSGVEWKRDGRWVGWRVLAGGYSGRGEKVEVGRWALNGSGVERKLESPWECWILAGGYSGRGEKAEMGGWALSECEVEWKAEGRWLGWWSLAGEYIERDEKMKVKWWGLSGAGVERKPAGR